MSGLVQFIADMQESHPLLSLVGAMLLGIGLVLAALLGLSFGIQPMARARHLVRNRIAIDVGLAGVVAGLLQPVSIALLAGSKLVTKSDEGYNFRVAVAVFVLTCIVNVISSVILGLVKSGTVLPSRYGRTFRRDRKISTAAIVDGLNAKLQNAAISPEDALKLVRDTLDVMLMHIRDYLGDLGQSEAYATLLVPDGKDLVVVARSSDLSGPASPRRCGIRYRADTMYAGLALFQRKPVSCGDLKVEKPEASAQKRYRSILALPLLLPDGSPVACLTFDSQRPYFFETFQRGKLENEIENDCAPYLKTMALIVNQMIGGSPENISKGICAASAAAMEKESRQ